jgi:hypothetical protein
MSDCGPGPRLHDDFQFECGTRHCGNDPGINSPIESPPFRDLKARGQRQAVAALDADPTRGCLRNQAPTWASAAAS